MIIVQTESNRKIHRIINALNLYSIFNPIDLFTYFRDKKIAHIPLPETLLFLNSIADSRSGTVH